jgi:hypothetical protein
MDNMRPLGELVTDALREGGHDEVLAQALIANGALERIIKLGTYESAEVQAIFGYSSDSLRAQLSKAKRGAGAFPLPHLDGRFWAREDIEAYKREHARKIRRRKHQRRDMPSNTDNGDIRDSAGGAGTESSRGNTDIGSVGANGDSGGDARPPGFDAGLGETR